MTPRASFGNLDNQLRSARSATEVPELPDGVWGCLATSMHDEVAGLDETVTDRLRQKLLIPPERYLEELAAFQAWMDFGHARADNPVVVRAQVITGLYVAFVWLRDSLMTPIAEALPEPSAFGTVTLFLRSDRRRMLRNAIAHGTWCYLPDFTGLECWDKSDQRFEVSQRDLDAWQILSRGTAIAALIALNPRWPLTL